ncbi:hypothetical protein MTBPR1_120026 [Candidatus Terasakiella magnetica]|uniref:Uncharacterized protein n=1 Tax=Candidatus Terasakiella magnetica TaxID=1867952 RepID=A0A1C3REK1_9PROT|nr:hypothetical protein MTBPR1_120026 [Candidatus Terasakiella magnetica]
MTVITDNNFHLRLNTYSQSNDLLSIRQGEEQCLQLLKIFGMTSPVLLLLSMV